MGRERMCRGACKGWIRGGFGVTQTRSGACARTVSLRSMLREWVGSVVDGGTSSFDVVGGRLGRFWIWLLLTRKGAEWSMTDWGG